jgi:hypothetical protein
VLLAGDLYAWTAIESVAHQGLSGKWISSEKKPGSKGRKKIWPTCLFLRFAFCASSRLRVENWYRAVR